MASNYLGFPVSYRDTVGVQLSVGEGVEVHVYDSVTEADVAESPLTTNADGEIEAGTFAAVPVGRLVRFRVENFGGRAFSTAQITTS